MNKDVTAVIGELCDFLGYDFSKEKIDALAKHVSLDNMRNNALEVASPEQKEMMKNHFRSAVHPKDIIIRGEAANSGLDALFYKTKLARRNCYIYFCMF
jgi:hypothetical protein